MIWWDSESTAGCSDSVFTCRSGQERLAGGEPRVCSASLDKCFSIIHLFTGKPLQRQRHGVRTGMLQNSVSFSGTPQLYCSTVDVWWGGFVRHQLFFVPSGLHPLVSQERNKETVQLIDVWRVFLIPAQEKKPETSHDHIRVGFTWNKTLCIPGLDKCHLICFWINVIFYILCTGLQQETGFNSMVWKLKIIAPCTVALSAFSKLIRYWSLEIKRTKTDNWDRYWQQNWESLCQKLQYNWLKYCS